MVYFNSNMKSSIHILLLACILRTVFGLYAPENGIALGGDTQRILSKAGEGQLADLHVKGKSLLGFHKELVDYQSVSLDEEAIALFVEEWLRNVGFTVEKYPVRDSEKKRYNIYAYIGQTNDSKVLVTSHIDTVPPFFPYRVDGTKIYGRGSVDAKASVATQIFSVLSLIEDGKLKEGDVSLLYVVGEELDGGGMVHFSEDVKGSWEVGIFGEPTELKLGVGHKGMAIFHLEAHGKASHSGYPELGVSASEILLPVLNELLNLKLPKSDLLGPSTLNVGKFSGGVAVNVIPEYASALVSVRVATDLKEIVSAVHEVVSGVEGLQISPVQAVEPQYLDFDVPGFDSITLAYSTDIPNIDHKFRKRIIYGPGSIHVAHGANEYVENLDLLKAVDGYKDLIAYALKV